MKKGTWSVEELQSIVANHQAEKVGGVLVDVQTANLIVNCYRSLNGLEIQAKWLQLPVDVLANKLWKIIR